ncbi:hypothetical protein QFC96_03505 [Latilactobacillus curvatus]|uniref:hypothetical protein n=1 Tax=Latilactobacillus curvatus TaxID=28038 RepID=UPI0024B9D897|nr:hypothetical protein [Latilactobacillus curvatus]WHQ78836.1 hypothetical protein QFC96_03505 [Latilactobacillus curvatus]
MKKLDEEFEMLMDEIKFDYDALAGGSAVTMDGKAIPNSQVAVSLAKNASRLSEILFAFEENNE